MNDLFLRDVEAETFALRVEDDPETRHQVLSSAEAALSATLLHHDQFVAEDSPRVELPKAERDALRLGRLAHHDPEQVLTLASGIHAGTGAHLRRANVNTVPTAIISALPTKLPQK